MTPYGLPRSSRLHLKRDFKAVIQGGVKLQYPGLVLWWRSGPENTRPARFAVVVSRKLGPAVVRNRTKRLLREAFRLSRKDIKPGTDIIVSPRNSEKLPTVQAAQSALTLLCGKAALLCRNPIEGHMNQISLVCKNFLLLLLNLFMLLVRPFLGPRGVCRFTPTCSQYAKQAIVKYGAFKGGYLALKRVLKCHPLHPGGYDPVP